MTSSVTKFLLTSMVLTGTILLFGIQASSAMTPAEEDKVRQAINNGNTHLRYKQYEKAIEEYEKAIKIDPTNRIARDNIGLVHNNWGTDYFNQRKFLDAKREWELALKINPGDGIARRNLQVLEIHIRNARRSARQGQFEKKEQEEENTESDASESDKDKPPVLKAQQAKEAEKKKEPPPPSAVILNMNTSTSSGNSNREPQTETPGDEFAGTSTDTTDGNGIDSILQDSINKLKSTKKAPSNTAGDTRGNSFKVVKKQQPPPEVKSTFKRVSEPEVKSSPPADKKLNLQDKITKLEKQVFGETRDDMPILKRIEMLEKDTYGKKQSGSIKSRVNELTKTYGI